MSDQDMRPDQADVDLRGRRLMQISTLTMAGMVIVLVRAMLVQAWGNSLVLGAGIATMLLCQWLKKRAAIEAASNTLILSVTAMVALLTWRGEGLRDSAVMAFPAVLISAGLLIKPKYLAGVVGAMLLFVGALVAGSTLGWRQDAAPDTLVNNGIDVVIILLVSSFAVWVMVGDLHKALGRLKIQVGQFRESQKSLTYLSQHDALTQLPNRILGRSRMEQAIANARRNGGYVALLFVDLDNFKAINDSMGHTAGDEFLKTVAQRLLESVRQTDVVCRQGGDEFLVGITDIAQGEAVSTVASKILARLNDPFQIQGTEISSSGSIGIAVFPDNGADYETLLRNADISVYHAKESGRNLFRFHDESMNTRMQENLQLIAGLRTAVARQEFVLHYQPVVDIVSGRMVGAEALIRWNDPASGLVAPDLFIPAAEKSGLIVEIGEWVIHEACRQMVAWQAAGHARFVLAVNLSPVQFRRGNMESIIEAALTSSGLNPDCLELEVTESTLIQDSERFIVSLRRLKALGIRISIDDFGTGYSNLSYLQRFSIDKLKIDQSFVKRLTNGPQDQAIVSAIIQIAKSLQLTTTAEGIEDEASRAQLVALGCDQGQGYLFARPMPAEQFEQLVLAVV